MIARLRTTLLFLTAACAMAGCSDGSDAEPGLRLQGCADSGSCAPNPPLVIGGDRPAMVHIPPDYNTATRYPLVMVLHGRGVTGMIQSIYMGLFERADRQQFVLVYPDGRVSSNDGRRQWRFTPTGPDTPPAEAAQISDVPYLRALIEEAAATYSIDPSRVGLIGHSSGGFMSFTMACEASDLVTAIVNLAGSTFGDFDLCRPAEERVSVLSIHGDLDDTVFYDGLDGIYLSAPAAAERYALLAGCDTGNPTAKPDFDLVANIDGAETSRTTWPGCLAGTEVEFWTMNDGPHIPVAWVEDGFDTVVNWLLTHPRD